MILTTVNMNTIDGLKYMNSPNCIYELGLTYKHIRIGFLEILGVVINNRTNHHTKIFDMNTKLTFTLLEKL